MVKELFFKMLAVAVVVLCMCLGGSGEAKPGSFANERSTRVKITSDKTLGGFDNTPIPWDATDFSDSGMWSSSDPTKLVVTRAGVWDIKARAWLNKSGAGAERVLSVRLNGDKIIAQCLRPGPVVSVFFTHEIAVTYKFAKDDYIELLAGADATDVIVNGDSSLERLAASMELTQLIN